MLRHAYRIHIPNSTRQPLSLFSRHLIKKRKTRSTGQQPDPSQVANLTKSRGATFSFEF